MMKIINNISSSAPHLSSSHIVQRLNKLNPSFNVWSLIDILHSLLHHRLHSLQTKKFIKEKNSLVSTFYSVLFTNSIDNLILTKSKCTCLSWPRFLERLRICSLRSFQSLASKQSWRISVAAFLVPATFSASLICFSSFRSRSIDASRFPLSP